MFHICDLDARVDIAICKISTTRNSGPESLILSSERPKNSHLWISLCILVIYITFDQRGLKTAGEDGFSWFCSRLIQMKNCQTVKSQDSIEPDFGPKLCSCGHLDHKFVTLVNAWHLNELKWRFWVTQDMSNWKCFVQFNDFMNVFINISERYHQTAKICWSEVVNGNFDGTGNYEQTAQSY